MRKVRVQRDGSPDEVRRAIARTREQIRDEFVGETDIRPVAISPESEVPLWAACVMAVGGLACGFVAGLVAAGALL